MRHKLHYRKQQICVHQSNYNCVSKLQVVFVTLAKLKNVITLTFRQVHVDMRHCALLRHMNI